MKIALILLGLFGVLHANPLNYDERDETVLDEFGTFIEPQPEILPNFEEEIAKFPGSRPPRPSPPPTYPPRTRPPQIHHNTINGQAPFFGDLVNVVLNAEGVQETVQKNKIEYNINGVRRTVADDFKEASD